MNSFEKMSDNSSDPVDEMIQKEDSAEDEEVETDEEDSEEDDSEEDEVSDEDEYDSEYESDSSFGDYFDESNESTESIQTNAEYENEDKLRSEFSTQQQDVLISQTSLLHSELRKEDLDSTSCDKIAAILGSMRQSVDKNFKIGLFVDKE